MAQAPKPVGLDGNSPASGLFPDGYEMKARSILIDRDGQKKVLGRVAIDDETKAIEFMETVGREGPLLEAVRKLRQTGDRKRTQPGEDPHVRGKSAGREAAEDVVQRISHRYQIIRRTHWRQVASSVAGGPHRSGGRGRSAGARMSAKPEL